MRFRATGEPTLGKRENFPMTIGVPLSLCALAALATGAAQPLLHALGVKRFPASMTFASLLLLGAVEPFAAVWFLCVPAAALWKRIPGRMEKFCALLAAAAVGGLLLCALGGLSLLVEPGVFLGLSAALLPALLGDRRTAMAAGFGALGVVLGAALALEGLCGVVFSLPNTAYFDAAVTAAIGSALLWGAVEGLKGRRRRLRGAGTR